MYRVSGYSPCRSNWAFEHSGLNFDQRLGFYLRCQVKSSLYINNRQPYGSLSNVLPGGQQWWKGVGAEMTEGFHLEATRHRVLTYVPSEKK